MNKINVNDPTAWQSLDWDDPVPLNIKSDHTVNKGRGNRLRAQNPKWIAEQTQRNKEQAQDPDWLAANRKASKWRNTPGAASAASKSQWLNPERLEQHLNVIQRNTELGLLKKNDEQRANVAKAKIRSSIMTPFGEYDSFAAFNQDYPEINVRDRMRLNPHQYYYTCDGPGKPTMEKVHYTPYGFHKYQKVLWELAKQANDANALSVAEAKYWFAKMKNKAPKEYYVLEEVKREWFGYSAYCKE